MARKLNTEEHETFNQLLLESEWSDGPFDSNDLSRRLSEKTHRSLDLSPELGFWFGEDVTQKRTVE
jgi:hypothetical protein